MEIEKIKMEKSFNFQIWVGLKETYNDEKIHNLDDVRKICDEFVNEIKDCITITPIEDRALELAERLMTELNQYRVTVTTPEVSFMLENENVKR